MENIKKDITKDMKILQVRNHGEKEDKRFSLLDPRLLKPPFLLNIFGQVASGKSTLLMNLLYNKSFYHKIFDSIIFISPTVRNDYTLVHLNQDDDVTKISDNLEDLDHILKALVEIQTAQIHKGHHMLIVLDDCLGYLKPKSYLSHLCTRYRHYKISLIVTSQSFRSIPNVIRTNSSGYILFGCTNDKEVEKLNDEFGGLIKGFRKLLDKSTCEAYSLMFINLKKVKAYKNFDELLYSKFDQ